MEVRLLLSPAHGCLRASLRRAQDLRRPDTRSPSGNPAADLINGGRIRKQLADVSKLFHVSECALRIFLPSDGAFDDKITEPFHYNAAGERGGRGVFCDEIAAVAIQGHIFYGIPAYSRAGSRTTRSRYNRFSFARCRFLLKCSIFFCGFSPTNGVFLPNHQAPTARNYRFLKGLKPN